MVDVDKLPPTQQLVLDVLAARYRLGETMWTFSTNCQSAINALEEHGLAGQMHGVIERTLRAWLTEAGKDAVLSKTYTPPGVARHQYEVRWAEEEGSEHVRRFVCDSEVEATELIEEMRTGVSKAGLRRKPYRPEDVSLWECAISAWRRLN